MEYLGPFTFNGVRFILGSISLIPIMLLNRKRTFDEKPIFPLLSNNNLLKGGIIIGLILFFGASLQQIGIIYTTAGSAGFITGLYIVLVPIIGIFFRHKSSNNIWIGAGVALIGLYLLSVKNDLTIDTGDLLILASTLFWALHVLIIAKYSPRTDSIQLAFFQFLLCGILSLIVALFTESIELNRILDAIIPILYAGIASTGIAYTLQVVAQRDAHPSNAAIIMSLEAVFAAIGGWIILSEEILLRGIIGCGLMLTGMIFSQINFTKLFSPKNQRII
jgi:drug/metabolite transporter (DMT)-like permease